MPFRNLRHLRVFLATADLRSPTAAAQQCHVSQPAVTQALAKLERGSGGALFERTRQGFFPTPRGVVLRDRLDRAMRRLDAGLDEIAPRLKASATMTQLQALIAVTEAQNTTLAARALELAQPTVHRAITQLEHAAGRPLFERSSFGLLPTRPCRDLAQAARLAFSEFQQAEADLAELDGREQGRITIGALPLSRSVVLPEALARFREARPMARITVLDGPYDEMLASLRRGSIDIILGALRDPLPIADVVQEPLFTDHLAVIARPGHPLSDRRDIPLKVLSAYPWCLPRSGTPAHAQVAALFAAEGLALPESIVESGSILLMREFLRRGDGLGCISARQAEAEVRNRLLQRLDTRTRWPGRRIGLTVRDGWVPTRAQADLLGEIRHAAAGIDRP
ncbi:LysR family transcriptional regulator [Ponticoccus gilvus]|nr:LysR family transcriptional regulator [Enemella evansiae]